MIYPDTFEKKIGFDTFRDFVKGKCTTTVGAEIADSATFLTQVDAIKSRLAETSEMVGILSADVDYPLDTFTDLSSALSGVRVPGSFLTEGELFSLLRILVITDGVVAFFAVKEDESPTYPYLAQAVSDLQPASQLVGLISGVIDKYGNIKDTASPHLRELRSEINRVSASINATLRRIMNGAREAGFIDKDVTPSVRDGRLVIPVSPMYKRKISGIVHDESATGKTVFIEPAEIVEANNSIREIEAEIRREIVRILIEVTDNVRPHIDSLLNTIYLLGNLDFIRAKALVAIDLGGNMPHLHASPTMEWYHAEHPALKLSLREQGKSVVPLDISLTDGNRILLISGPNAGGKSVALKTVGVNQYMLQCGFLPLVYENSHFGVFTDMFIDIGDQQSIEDDLSTYSSHLLNMKQFMSGAKSTSVVLIDEFGGGTEPQIGGALAQAILRALNDRKVYGVITTHYTNLKHFADDTDGIINGAMLYDRQQMQPLFQLSVGYPGSSFALEIARKIGLPDSVIDEAKEIVGSDYVNLDKYVLDIARDKRYWENKRQQIRIKEKRLTDVIDSYEENLDSLKEQRKHIIKQAKTEASEIIVSANATVERTVHAIKKANAERERTKEIRQQLDEFKKRISEDEIESSEVIKKFESKNTHKRSKGKAKAETAKPAAPSIAVGDNVTIDGSNSVGTVVSVSGKNAVVTFGAMKTTVAIDRLKKTIKNSTEAVYSSHTNSAWGGSQSRERQLNFKPDLDVRGMRTDEAIQAVTYFLDDATQFGISRVRILHGTGNGILRQNIRKYLDTYQAVERYRDEHVQFGGAGITVIDLN